MNRVIHFEIHADDLDRAAKFYTEIFGWSITKREGGNMEYYLIKTGDKDAEGINGGMLKRPCAVATGGDVGAFACTIDVENLDAILSAVIAHGGKMAMPKMIIPGMGRLAYAIDTEGNTFGMMQPDSSVK